MLNLVEFNGSKTNNLIPKERVMPYMFRDSNETDSNKLYKGLFRHGSTDTNMQSDLYFSPDGLNWTAYENNPVIDTSPRIGRWGPTGFLGWDPMSLPSPDQWPWWVTLTKPASDSYTLNCLSRLLTTEDREMIGTRGQGQE